MDVTIRPDRGNYLIKADKILVLTREKLYNLQFTGKINGNKFEGVSLYYTIALNDNKHQGTFNLVKKE